MRAVRDAVPIARTATIVSLARVSLAVDAQRPHRPVRARVRAFVHPRRMRAHTHHTITNTISSRRFRHFHHLHARFPGVIRRLSRAKQRGGASTRPRAHPRHRAMSSIPTVRDVHFDDARLKSHVRLRGETHTAVDAAFSSRARHPESLAAVAVGARRPERPRLAVSRRRVLAHRERVPAREPIALVLLVARRERLARRRAQTSRGGRMRAARGRGRVEPSRARFERARRVQARVERRDVPDASARHRGRGRARVRRHGRRDATRQTVARRFERARGSSSSSSVERRREEARERERAACRPARETTVRRRRRRRRAPSFACSVSTDSRKTPRRFAPRRGRCGNNCAERASFISSTPRTTSRARSRGAWGRPTRVLARGLRRRKTRARTRTRRRTKGGRDRR